MVFCEMCGKEFKNRAGLAGHKQLEHHAGEVSDQRLIAVENRLSAVDGRLEELLDYFGVQPQSAGATPMAQQVDQTAAMTEAVNKALDARGERQELVAAKARIAELENAPDPGYAAMVIHAASCPNCKVARQADVAEIAVKMLKELTGPELVELAIERNAIPTRFEIPD